MTDRFAFAARDNAAADKPVENKPRWAETIAVFSKNKGAVIGFAFLLLMIILAIAGPMVSGYTYDGIELSRQNLPPRIQGIERLGIFNGTLGDRNMYEAKGYGGSYFWFGTDKLGRDLFTRFCCGVRISLIIGAISALLNMIIGVAFGLVSGYYGGKPDLLMQRFIEVLNGIPTLVIVSLLVIVLKPGMMSIIITMGLAQWTGTARLVRANTLRLKETEHVLASKTLGTSTVKILFREIFPNLLSSVIVIAMMSVPGAIFMEAFLSFVGLGIPNPEASLGSLINDGYQSMLLYPFQMTIPAVFFALLMLALNIIGDGLRDALDPTQRQI
ncbi:MAG: ABC transporter permease [Oscillospiraceae bacterium]|jgi:oligopeptide transport system permease protein|nr:ABC transporter permease [Oscillospiraceae bacterium]